MKRGGLGRPPRKNEILEREQLRFMVVDGVFQRTDVLPSYSRTATREGFCEFGGIGRRQLRSDCE